MKRTILLALLAILPLLAPAAGTATVRVTNAGSVPIVVEGRTIRPSATASISVPAGEAGAFNATAAAGFGISAPASYPSLRAGGTYSLRLSAERGAATSAPVSAPPVPAPAPAPAPASAPVTKPMPTNGNKTVSELVAPGGDTPGFNDGIASVEDETFLEKLTKLLPQSTMSEFFYDPPSGAGKVPWVGSCPGLKDHHSDEQMKAFSEMGMLAEESYKDGGEIPEGYFSLGFGLTQKYVGEGFDVGLNGTISKNRLNGFEASLYLKPDTGELILAFAGTDSISDIKDDIVQIKEGIIPRQYELAEQLVRNVLASSGDAKIVVVGHSLGGALVQYSIARTGAPDRLTGVTFNTAGLARRVMQSLPKQSVLAASRRITNIRNDGDSVSFIGSHIGPMYEVPNEGFRAHGISILNRNIVSRDALVKELSERQDVSLPDFSALERLVDEQVAYVRGLLASGRKATREQFDEFNSLSDRYGKEFDRLKAEILAMADDARKRECLQRLMVVNERIGKELDPLLVQAERKGLFKNLSSGSSVSSPAPHPKPAPKPAHQAHPCIPCWTGDLVGTCSDPKCPNYGNPHRQYKGGGMPNFGDGLR